MLKSQNAISGRGTKSEATLKTEAALERFKTIPNTEPLYPQIFIPFYKELKEANKIGQEQPIIVFRDGPSNYRWKISGVCF